MLATSDFSYDGTKPPFANCAELIDSFQQLAENGQSLTFEAARMDNPLLT